MSPRTRSPDRLTSAGTTAQSFSTDPRALVDASGVRVDLPSSPIRIVSLVPSVTETLFALGLGDRLAAITTWCVHPAGAIALKPRVGGTKNPDIPAIERLAPDLVLANLEENREIDVRRLRERGLSVWVDFPCTVDDAIEQIRRLAALGARADALAEMLCPIEQAVAAARSTPPRRRLRGFIPIWRDPWMSISRRTYAHDLLSLVGIDTIFADSVERYPRVTLEQVAALDPDLVLLPDEPYRFTAEDADLLGRSEPLGATSAARRGAIHVIDGTLPFWHGPRLGRAIESLAALAAATRALDDDPAR